MYGTWTHFKKDVCQLQRLAKDSLTDMSQALVAWQEFARQLHGILRKGSDKFVQQNNELLRCLVCTLDAQTKTVCSKDAESFCGMLVDAAKKISDAITSPLDACGLGLALVAPSSFISAFNAHNQRRLKLLESVRALASTEPMCLTSEVYLAG